MLTWIDASKEKPEYDECTAAYVIVLGEYRYKCDPPNADENFNWTVGPVVCDWSGVWREVIYGDDKEYGYAIVVRRWAHFPEPPPFEK